MPRRDVVLLFALAATVLCAAFAPAREEQSPHRWLFVMRNLRAPENLERTIALCPRAAAAGYNALVLSDGSLYDVEEAGPDYADNVRRLQREAARHGMELIPCVMPIGYSGSILGHDPNLAEGLPVKDAPFVARGGVATLVPDREASLPGGDFEEAEDHRFDGWDWQDNAGQSIFADHEVVHGGQTSVRMENIPQADPEHGHCRFMRTVKVRPHRQYRVSAWIRTEDFEAPGSAHITILAPTEEERSLSFAQFEIAPTQDWRQYHLVFNSLGWDTARVYFGTWAGKGGRIWWDDVVLEEVGLLNVLRRDGCPVAVRGEDGTPYEEGVDYDPIRDPQLSPWRASHAPPAIRLKEGTRIPDGARLLVSYYHSIVIGEWQVMCCLSDPKVYDILAEQVRGVEELLHPSTFFMQHDEIRVANWDEACQSRGLTPGELLADNARRCVQIIREVSPDAKIWVWSDMFDPHHNAVDQYYLVNGSWRRSWEGLDPDVGIVNWAGHLEGRNLRWFAERGHQQVLAGYYDHDADGSAIRDWLAAGEGLPGILGAMYTTWQDDYDHMAPWAAAAWGTAEESAPPEVEGGR